MMWMENQEKRWRHGLVTLLHHALLRLHHDLWSDHDHLWRVGLLLASDDDEDGAHDTSQHGDDGDDEASSQFHSGEFISHFGCEQDTSHQRAEGAENVEDTGGNGNPYFSSAAAARSPAEENAKTSGSQTESDASCGSPYHGMLVSWHHTYDQRRATHEEASLCVGSSDPELGDERYDLEDPCEGSEDTGTHFQTVHHDEVELR